MGDQEITAALHDALATKSYTAMRTYLRLVREHRLRDPENVAVLGAELLREHHRKLPQDELWTLHEQVTVAALEAGSPDLAFSLIKNVNKRFPDSVRASRLTGMFVEYSGDYDRAEELYKKELDSSPHNPLILKRMVALKKGRGDLAGAIDELRKYLDVQQSDWMAWEELADLYLQVQMYQQAAFCLEEVILHQPTNLGAHLLYADTLYTMGGAQNWRTARAYFSGVIEMTNGSSLHALHGVCACAAQLATLRAKERGQDDDAGLARLAAEALLQRYAADSPDKLPQLKELLSKQGLL